MPKYQRIIDGKVRFKQLAYFQYNRRLGDLGISLRPSFRLIRGSLTRPINNSLKLLLYLWSERQHNQITPYYNSSDLHQRSSSLQFKSTLFRGSFSNIRVALLKSRRPSTYVQYAQTFAPSYSVVKTHSL